MLARSVKYQAVRPNQVLIETDLIADAILMDQPPLMH